MLRFWAKGVHLFLSQSVDYLGFLNAKLRDLKGWSTLANELVQNADDADGASQIVMEVNDEGLIVTNDAAFSDCGSVDQQACAWDAAGDGRKCCDFHAFRRVASGHKRQEEDTTGAFGIGFISVYQITDRPTLRSGRWHWRMFPDAAEDRRISAEHTVEMALGTRFEFPWSKEANELRSRLGMEPVSMDVADLMAEELASALVRAAPFLKRLGLLELRLRGTTISLVRCDRDPSGDEILVDANGHPQLWKRLTTDFNGHANALRKKYGVQIEAKRKSLVTVAVPLDLSAEQGLLYASLPTEQRIDLPVLINADFYPSTDRKRILFDADFQGDWNRSAIQAAGVAFAASLPVLREALQPEALWQLLSKAQGLATATQAANVDPSFASFWTNAKPALQVGAYVWNTKGKFCTPQDSKQSGVAQEAVDCLPLFESVGLNIVHPSLRSYFNALREVGVKDLDLDALTTAIQQVGLTAAIALAAASPWLQKAANRATLSQFLEVLYQRVPKDRLPVVKQRLLTCSLWATAGGSLAPAIQVWQGSAKTRRIFAKLDGDDMWAAADEANAPWMADLLDTFDVPAAIELLAETSSEALAAAHKANPKWLSQLLEWFEERQAEIADRPELKARLRLLPIWPSGGGLRPLEGLSVPGPFEDPFRIAQLLDAEISARFSVLLVNHLGARRLDLPTYLADQVPLAMSAETHRVTADTKRWLLKLLSREFGQIRDNDRVRNQLSVLQLVECEDGLFRKAKDVYLRTPHLVEMFGDDRTRFSHPSLMRAASSVDVLKWLGVSDLPVASDLLRRVDSIVTDSKGESRIEMQSFIKGLVEVWPQIAGRSTGLAELKTKAWLPTTKQIGWAAPGGVFSSFREFLFASQVQFIDVSRPVQAQAQRLGFFDFLGVKGEPTPAQVVAHLLHEAKAGTKVSPELFVYLEQNHQEACVARLRDEDCLPVADAGYVRPSRVFSGPHYFGRFRHRLGQDWLRFANLLQALGVREQPSTFDAALVLEEMADDYADRRQLSESDCEINLYCWRLLAMAGALHEDHVHRLESRAVVPNANRFMRLPSDVYFEDRPGLAAKFDEAVQACTIRRPEAAWVSMAMAGVRDLSKVVETRIVECDDPRASEAWGQIVADRWPLVRRVMASLQNVQVDACPASPPEIWQTHRLVLCYALVARVTAAEEATALFDRESSRILIVEERKGVEAALARELAFLIQPDAGSGPLAAALKELLTADTIADASSVLSDLGFADVDLGSTGLPEEALGAGIDSDDSIEPGLGAATDGDPRGGHGSGLGKDSTGSDDFNGTGADGGHDGSGTGSAGGDRGTHTGTEAPTGRASRPAAGKKFVLRSYVQPARPASDEPPVGEGNKQQLEVDRRGTELVMAFEKRAGRFPKKMPHFHEGYDVESYREDGSLDRYIEIKSLSAPWNRSSVGMSDSQYLMARRRRLMFWLYVVEDLDSSSPKIHKIRDPATRVVDYRFDDGWREAAVLTVDDERAADGELEHDVLQRSGGTAPQQPLSVADENPKEQIT